MTPPSDRILAIQHLLASIFASQRALKVLAPEFNWSGLGNLLGDFGELVAIEAYNLKKAPPGATSYDALTPDGKHRIQIKTNYAASQVGFRGMPDLLLVLHVSEDGKWEQVYLGPFTPVYSASRRSERDNKNMIAITKLRELQKLHGLVDINSPLSFPTPEVLPTEPSGAN